MRFFILGKNKKRPLTKIVLTLWGETILSAAFDDNCCCWPGTGLNANVFAACPSLQHFTSILICDLEQGLRPMQPVRRHISFELFDYCRFLLLCSGPYTSIVSCHLVFNLRTITTWHLSHLTLITPFWFLLPITICPQFEQCHLNGVHSSRFVMPMNLLWKSDHRPITGLLDTGN